MTTRQPNVTFFSRPRITTILVWGAAQPREFGTRIVTGHKDHSELASLRKHCGMNLPWFVHATQATAATTTKVAGSEWEFGTAEEAPAQILRLGRVAPDVAWSACVHTRQSSSLSSYR